MEQCDLHLTVDYSMVSDTDSLLCRINCEDLYRELEESNVLDQLDFSNYPEDHKLYSEENKRVVLKFKDEFCWGLYKRVYMSEAKTVQHYFRWWVFYIK